MDVSELEISQGCLATIYLWFLGLFVGPSVSELSYRHFANEFHVTENFASDSGHILHNDFVGPSVPTNKKFRKGPGCMLVFDFPPLAGPAAPEQS